MYEPTLIKSLLYMIEMKCNVVKHFTKPFKLYVKAQITHNRDDIRMATEGPGLIIGAAWEADQIL